MSVGVWSIVPTHLIHAGITTCAGKVVTRVQRRRRPCSARILPLRLRRQVKFPACPAPQPPHETVRIHVTVGRSACTRARSAYGVIAHLLNRTAVAVAGVAEVAWPSAHHERPCRNVPKHHICKYKNAAHALKKGLFCPVRGTCPVSANMSRKHAKRYGTTVPCASDHGPVPFALLWARIDHS